MSVRSATRTEWKAVLAAGRPETAVYRRAVPGRSSPNWVRLGVTAVAAVVVAEAAAWLLRPRDVEEPVHADENAFFSQEELTKARDYASGQRLILRSEEHTNELQSLRNHVCRLLLQIHQATLA